MKLRVRLLAGAVALLSVMTAAVTPAAASPSPAATIVSGWVTVRSPGLASYTPADVDQALSLGGPATVTRLGPGDHLVEMPGVGQDAGIVHIAPLGTKQRFCSVGEWGTAGSTLEVATRCYDASGTPRDTRFMVSWFYANGITAGLLGHVWADQSATASYTPSHGYQFDSEGGTITIDRLARGDYRVTFGDLGAANGSAVVSAYGTLARVCRVVSWLVSGADARVRVRCTGTGGAPADARFTLTWMSRNTLDYLSDGGYLKATGTVASQNVTSLASTYRSGSGTTKVIRTNTGRWNVTFASMPRGGSAFVSGLGASGLGCRITSIRTSGSPATIGVACKNAAGAYANGPFALSLVTYPLAL